MNAAIQWIKTNNKLSFVDWCPTGFKIGLDDVPAALLKNDDVGASPRSVYMLGNNIGIFKDSTIS